MSEFFDDVDNFFESYADSAWGILFEVFCVIYCFFALAIVCDEYLAPALETLCVHWGVREDVAGATFLAFGSAAPEIVINAVATIKSQVTSSNTTSLGISAIIGSGMIAFSFIPAMCCFSSEIELKLKRRPLLRDELFYLIALFMLCAAFRDGKIVLYESVFLLTIYFAHLATIVGSPWIRQTYRHKVKGLSIQSVSAQDSFVHKARAELERQRSLKKSKSHGQLLPASASAPVTPREKKKNDMPSLKRASTTNALFEPSTSINSGHVTVNTNSNIFAFDHEESLDFDEEESTEIDITAHDSMAQALAGNEGTSQLGINTLTETMDEPLLNDHDHNGDEYDETDGSLSTDSDEEASTLIGKVMYWITIPLQLLFKFTCPPAGEGQSCEKLYAVTFVIGVIHVAIFSFILSSVVGAWVTTWGMPQALFGMLLIAIGAEIPDTIESVTMAKKTYGSMAVSNCQGTQVINIGIGLGLPWLLTNLTGNQVEVCGNNILQISAFFQTFIVCTNFFLLVGLALIKKENKALLQKWKAVTLIGLYFMTMFGFTLYLYLSGELFKNTCK